MEYKVSTAFERKLSADEGKNWIGKGETIAELKMIKLSVSKFNPLN